MGRRTIDRGFSCLAKVGDPVVALWARCLHEAMRDALPWREWRGFVGCWLNDDWMLVECYGFPGLVWKWKIYIIIYLRVVKRFQRESDFQNQAIWGWYSDTPKKGKPKKVTLAAARCPTADCWWRTRDFTHRMCRRDFWGMPCRMTQKYPEYEKLWINLLNPKLQVLQNWMKLDEIGTAAQIL